MSPFHLIYIIPLSASLGAFFMALVAGRRKDERNDY